MSYRKVLGELSIVVAAALLLMAGSKIGTSARSEQDFRRTESSAVILNPNFSTTITTGSTAQALATAMGVPTADIVSAAIEVGTDNRAWGVGSTALSYFPTAGTTYAILSTGDASKAEVPSSGNWSTDLTGTDTVRLHLRLKVPAGMTCMSFDFAFYSEEFPEWLNSAYNDAFLAEKGGTNIQTTYDPVTHNPIISSTYNFAFDSGHNTISVNSAFGISANTGNAYDGVTPLLKAQTSVVPGSTIDVYLTIMDVGDSLFDSSVFLDNFQWRTDANCASGAISEGQFLPPDANQKWTRSIRVDSNGNGRPDENDETIELVREANNSNYMTAQSPRWGQSIVEMSNPNPLTGDYQTIIHKRPQPALAASLGHTWTSPAIDTRTETTIFTLTGLDPLLKPSSFSINQTTTIGTTTTVKTGQGAAVDSNSDGKPDVFQGQGTGQPLVSITPVYSDINGDGKSDFMSIPWALSQAIGVNTNDAVPDPQVWIPLGDTNGDGTPDSPAFDFNHDNKIDPGFPAAPMVAGPANPTGSYFLYFPQFVDGLVGAVPFVSQIILINLDRNNDATNVSVGITDQDGDPMSLMLDGASASGGKTVTIPKGGMKIIKSGGTGSLKVGAVKVFSKRPLAGVVTYQGTGFGAAGVGASPAFDHGFVAAIRKHAASRIDAGIAIMNLEDFPVSINPELFLSTGVRKGGADRVTIVARGQVALMLADFFWDFNETDLNDFSGLFKAAASGRVAAAVLQTSPSEYATLPVVSNANPLGAATTAVKFGESEPYLQLAATTASPQIHTLRFPQFANGRINAQVWISSTLYLFNQDPLGAANVTVYIRGDNGTLLPVKLNGAATTGQYAFSLPSNSFKSLATDAQGTVLAGSVLVTSDREISGVLVWTSPMGIAGVGVAQDLSQGFVAPMEKNNAANINTGIGVMNLADTAATLNVELVNLNGATLATSPVTIPARGHIARFVDQFTWGPAQNLNSFQGILRVTSGSKPIAATVIQTKPNQYVTMPVAPRL